MKPGKGVRQRSDEGRLAQRASSHSAEILWIPLYGPQAVTYGSAGGKLPMGKEAARSPALSLTAARRIEKCKDLLGTVLR